MDDKECMEGCVKDAKNIVAGVFHICDYPDAYDAIARIATTLFDKRYPSHRGQHCLTNGVTGAGKGEGIVGRTGAMDEIEEKRVISFLSSRTQRQSLCRKLGSLAGLLRSSTPGKEIVEGYREMAYDTIDAIERTLR